MGRTIHFGSTKKVNLQDGCPRLADGWVELAREIRFCQGVMGLVMVGYAGPKAGSEV